MVNIFLHHLKKPGSDGKQCFAGAGLAEQRDQVDVFVEQCVECETLPEIERFDAENPSTGCRQLGNFCWRYLRNSPQSLFLAVVRGLEQDVLVGRKLAVLLLENAVSGAQKLVDLVGVPLEFVISDTHFPAMLVWLGVVFGVDAEGIGLEPQVDALGDDDRRRVGVVFVEVNGQVEDPVVNAGVELQPGIGQHVLAFAGKDAQQAAVVEADAFAELGILPVHIELLDDRPGIVAELCDVSLESVQLLDHLERNDNGVIGKDVDRVGIVQQDVGVENEIFSHRLDWCSPSIQEFRRFIPYGISFHDPNGKLFLI